MNLKVPQKNNMAAYRVRRRRKPPDVLQVLSVVIRKPRSLKWDTQLPVEPKPRALMGSAPPGLTDCVEPAGFRLLCFYGLSLVKIRDEGISIIA